MHLFKYIGIGIVSLMVCCKSQEYAKEIVVHNLSASVIPSRDIPKKDSLSLMLEVYRSATQSKMSEILCFSEQEMFKNRPEGLLNNWCADVLLNRAKSDFPHLKVDFCLINFGGLRSSLPQGAVTRGDIYQLMPFENELVIVELNYAQMLDMAQYITKKGGEPLAGISMVIDTLNVKTVKFNIGLDTLQNRKYTVVTSDYLASGGDAMNFLQESKLLKSTGIKIRDAFMDVCIVQDTIQSALDHRISYH